jgi:hypothetical protein
MTRPPCLHLTEDHVGAAKRIFHDAINSKISAAEATRNAEHLQSVSPPAAALLWQWLVAYRSQKGLLIEEIPLSDDEYEDRPQRKPR